MVLLKKVVIVAGTPGTGKSSICSKLAEICGLRVVNLSQLAVEKGFVVMYDKLRNTHVIDEERLAEYVVELVKSSNSIVIQTHYPEVIPKNIVDIVFILRTHPLILEKRLIERGWSRKKINENVMAEILGVVAINALTAFGEDRVFEIDTSDTKPEEVANLMCSVIRGATRLEPGIKIDWLTALSPEEVIRFENYVGEEG